MNYEIRTVHKENLEDIAGLHMGTGDGGPRSSHPKQSSSYRFFQDKVRLFYEFDPQSIVAAFTEKGELAGCLIFTYSEPAFNRFCGPGHFRFYKKLLCLLKGDYGFNFKKYFRAGRSMLGKNKSPQDRALQGEGGKIWVLLVHPKHQRQGMAGQLLEETFHRFTRRGGRRLGVTVTKDNLPAIAVYKKKGFEITGESMESSGLSYAMEKTFPGSEAVSDFPAQRIKIIHLVTRLIPGGAQKIVMSLTSGLAGKGYEVLLATGAQGVMDPAAIKKELDQAGVKWVMIAQMVREIAPVLDVLCLIKLYCLLKKERPAILHTHTSKAGILGRLAGRLAGVRTMIHTPHGHIYRPDARIEGVPGQGLLLKLFKACEKWSNSFSQKVITLTVSEKNEMISLRLAGEERLQTIYNAVDVDCLLQEALSRSESRKKYRFQIDQFVVGSVGRFSKVKGHLEFLKAARLVMLENPNIHFALVGTGPDEDELRDYVKAHHLEHGVSFLGYQDKIAEILPSFDLFVMPSLYEGFGLSVLEAWVFRLPVIATKVGGLMEIIEEGRDGRLVEPANPQAMKEQILDLYSHPTAREMLGDCGFKKLQREFSLEAMICSHHDLYQGLLQSASLKNK